MNSFWLKKNNNENLIIFFNGWAMDKNCIKHLSTKNFDIIVFYDYENFVIQKDILPEVNAYRSQFLVAWSMGVFVASKVYKNFEKIVKKIAFNGTLKPVDDFYGIPLKIFNLTIENFSSSTLEKFMIKSGINNLIFEQDEKKLCKLKNELIQIKNQRFDTDLTYDDVYISMQDRIFPPKNQLNFWSTQNCRIKKIAGSHCPFENFSSWVEILR